jgi:hypothetical protein
VQAHSITLEKKASARVWGARHVADEAQLAQQELARSRREMQVQSRNVVKAHGHEWSGGSVAVVPLASDASATRRGAKTVGSSSACSRLQKAGTTFRCAAPGAQESLRARRRSGCWRAYGRSPEQGDGGSVGWFGFVGLLDFVVRSTCRRCTRQRKPCRARMRISSGPHCFCSCIFFWDAEGRIGRYVP